MARRRLVKRGGKPPPLTVEEEAALKSALQERPWGLSETGRELLARWEQMTPERRAAVGRWWRLPKAVRSTTPYPEEIFPVYPLGDR